MKEEIKQLWVAALRSKNYEQGYFFLRENDKYCCLGVLCDLAIKDGVIGKSKKAAAIAWKKSIHCEGAYAVDGKNDQLPLSVYTWAELDSANPQLGKNALSMYNDGVRILFNINGVETERVVRRYSFDEIADLIEDHL